MSHTPIRSIRELLESILEMVKGVRVLSAVRGVLQDLRVSVVNTPSVTIGSGTVTTVTTVTTVATVTNQAQMGGYLANPLVQALTNNTARNGVYKNITVV